MKHILIKIEYKGTRYCGWQIQPNTVTVQQTIQGVFQQICQTPISIKACSRTDSGVHAIGQVASVEIPEHLALNKLFRSVNSLLPEDIAVTDLVEIPADYNLRQHAAGKRYIYRVLQSPILRVFEAETHLLVKSVLDIDKARHAIMDLRGTHDFSAFRGRGCQQPDPVKTISYSAIDTQQVDEYATIAFVFEGSGFLKNMIRIMVGSLLDIARGKKKENSIRDALTSGDRSDAGLTAPAKGLVLDRVFLQPDPFKLRTLGGWEND